MDSPRPLVPRVVIAGGSGFIGRQLVEEFSTAGYEIIVLSRSGSEIAGAKVVKWDGLTVGEWPGFLSGAQAVINLSGESVSTKWTDESKARIRDSRVRSTETIGKAIRTCPIPPAAWINASAIGFYGDRGEEEVNENSSAGTGFLAETCLAWEAAQDNAETPGVRKTKIRVGVVLGKGGGAMEEMLKYAKRFLGGAQGSGNQWVSWIHVEDLARIFRWAVENPVPGIVNGVAPSPARNKILMQEVRRAVNRPWSPPVPGPILKMVGSILGVESGLLLVSEKVRSTVLGDFVFKFPTLYAAIQDIVQDSEPAKPSS